MSCRSAIARLRFAGLLLVLAPLAGALAANGRTLHLYTWSEYLDPELVAEFEAEHDAKLRFSYFESDELRDQELAASGGSGYDLIMVNSTRIESYGRRGWLAPIDHAAVPNLRHVEPRWRDAVPGARDYGVPFLMGTLGIAWRDDLVTSPPTSWAELLGPSAELDGRVMMNRSPRELLGVALQAAGESANDPSREALERAGERLLAQKPHLLDYGYPSLGPESLLSSGKVHAAMMYSGDVLLVQEHTPSIAYTLPSDGGLLWIDYLGIASSSRNKALAHAFIDFLNRPANAARLAEALYYATPNAAARALLPAAFLADPVINPSPAELERAELLTPLPPRRKKQLNGIGAQLFLQ